MKVLKAKFNKFERQYLDPFTYEQKTLTVNAEPYELKDIFGGVDQEKRKHIHSFKKLLDNIKINGMLNPVVLVPNTKEIWDQGFIGVVDKDLILEYDISFKYLCIFGTQRLYIAERLGYDAIDGFFVENVNHGLLIGKSLEDKAYHENR